VPRSRAGSVRRPRGATLGARVGARTRLRGGVEHGVAAALVGEHQVVGAGAVAQGQRRALARAPAVTPGLAVAQEARKHAVLGVEDGQVVVRDRLQRRRPAQRRSSAGRVPAGAGRRLPGGPRPGAARGGRTGAPGGSAVWGAALSCKRGRVRAQLGTQPGI